MLKSHLGHLLLVGGLPKANIVASPHKVDIYMAVWPNIKFEYVGSNIDREI